MNDNDVLEEQINELFDEYEAATIRLSTWEETFICDMKERIDKSLSFSERQVAQIERLYNKHISGDSDEPDPKDTFSKFGRR